MPSNAVCYCWKMQCISEDIHQFYHAGIGLGAPLFTGLPALWLKTIDNQFQLSFASRF